MKIVIQCASKKAGSLWNVFGKQVNFVAHPEKCVPSTSVHYCRPDDDMNIDGETWREYLVRYNARRSNLDKLLCAGFLYKHRVYGELMRQYESRNVFILSAGWGLIRSDFLTPQYDITFSTGGESCSRRRRTDAFQDFNHLREDGVDDRELIYFFGGNAYLALFYHLTQDITARKVIYINQKKPDYRKGYEYIQYATKQRTNWHYSCARDFIASKVPM